METVKSCGNCLHKFLPSHSEPCNSCSKGRDNAEELKWVPRPVEELPESTEEHTGGSSSYYGVDVTNPTSGGDRYFAECNDIIESLGMTFAEGNAFKAIWRTAAARNGKKKQGNNAVYDAEKVVFFGERMLAQAKENDE